MEPTSGSITGQLVGGGGEGGGEFVEPALVTISGH